MVASRYRVRCKRRARQFRKVSHAKAHLYTDEKRRAAHEKKAPRIVRRSRSSAREGFRRSRHTAPLGCIARRVCRDWITSAPPIARTKPAVFSKCSTHCRQCRNPKPRLGFGRSTMETTRSRHRRKRAGFLPALVRPRATMVISRSRKSSSVSIRRQPSRSSPPKATGFRFLSPNRSKHHGSIHQTR